MCAASRLQGHFRDRHYSPAQDVSGQHRKAVGDRPLSWWAVKRVSEYSGRVNLWLAGGFAVLYAAYTVAGEAWPSWLGRQVFVTFDQMGGVPTLATALVVLAAVPAAFQYGLWRPGTGTAAGEYRKPAACARAGRVRLLASGGRRGLAAGAGIFRSGTAVVDSPGDGGAGRNHPSAGGGGFGCALVGVVLPTRFPGVRARLAGQRPRPDADARFAFGCACYFGWTWRSWPRWCPRAACTIRRCRWEILRGFLAPF